MLEPFRPGRVHSLGFRGVAQGPTSGSDTPIVTHSCLTPHLLDATDLRAASNTTGASKMWTRSVISGRDTNTGADQQLHTFCKQKDQLRGELEAGKEPVRHARPKASRLGQHQT